MKLVKFLRKPFLQTPPAAASANIRFNHRKFATYYLQTIKHTSISKITNLSSPNLITYDCLPRTHIRVPG